MSSGTTADRRWRAATVLLFVVLAGVMFGTFRDYGITGDEGVRNRYGRRLLRYYASLGADRDAVADVDISRDGGVFEITAGLVGAVSPLDTYDTRHLVVVGFALLGFLAVHAVARPLGGARAAFLAVLALAATPPFYGHAFNNSKDVPFAALFALAAAAVLRLAADGLAPRVARLASAAAAIGLVAGERVAGLVFLGYLPLLWLGLLVLEKRRDVALRLRPVLARLGGAWLALAALAWAVMLAFWPWAQTRPLRNPIQALQMFSNFWDCMVVFFDGRHVCSGEVTRLYLPTWFALTLPEHYFVALVLAVVALRRLVRRPSLAPETAVRLLRAGWLLFVAGFPVAWAVAFHTPLYDGLRHFLFVMPLLAVLAGLAAHAYVASAVRPVERAVAGLCLGGALVTAFVDMTQLHPYQALYFNRAVAGGLERAITRYEGDYWCLSYKEGVEWLVKRYAGAQCPERIRVAGHSVFQQTAYYVRKTEEARRLLQPTDGRGDPHFVLATTRHGDHENTPGRLVHQVKRQHAAILYLFQLKPPSCAPSALPAPSTP